MFTEQIIYNAITKATRIKLHFCLPWRSFTNRAGALVAKILLQSR